jgi:hypothetical protein
MPIEPTVVCMTSICNLFQAGMLTIHETVSDYPFGIVPVISMRK